MSKYARICQYVFVNDTNTQRDKGKIYKYSESKGEW